MFLNIVFFSCVCLFVPCVYVIKIIIIIILSSDYKDRDKNNTNMNTGVDMLTNLQYY